MGLAPLALVPPQGSAKEGSSTELLREILHEELENNPRGTKEAAAEFRMIVQENHVTQLPAVL